MGTFSKGTQQFNKAASVQITAASTDITLLENNNVDSNGDYTDRILVRLEAIEAKTNTMNLSSSLVIIKKQLQQTTATYETRESYSVSQAGSNTAIFNVSAGASKAIFFPTAAQYLSFLKSAQGRLQNFAGFSYDVQGSGTLQTLDGVMAFPEIILHPRERLIFNAGMTGSGAAYVNFTYQVFRKV